MKNLLTAAAVALTAGAALAQSTDSIQAGAIYTAPAGETITSVSGVFRVPELSVPLIGPYANRRGIYTFSIHIGIGTRKGYGVSSGCAASAGLIRAGIDVFYNAYADVSQPFGWYQYGVETDLGAFAYAGLNVAPGDLIKLTATADGSTVTAVTENYGKVDTTAGKQPVQSMPPTYGVGNTASGSICRTEAGWLLEDHMTEEDASLPVIVGNFTDVVFSELTIRTSGSAVITGSKLVDMEIEKQGGKLTSCGFEGENLRCKRVVVPK
ncbi:hypothetical protein OQA88_6369 [Cercophora sp. LCS_1]